MGVANWIYRKLGDTGPGSDDFIVVMEADEREAPLATAALSEAGLTVKANVQVLSAKSVANARYAEPVVMLAVRRADETAARKVLTNTQGLNLSSFKPAVPSPSTLRTRYRRRRSTDGP